jgi:hypothetical protein
VQLLDLVYSHLTGGACPTDWLERSPCLRLELLLCPEAPRLQPPSTWTYCRSLRNDLHGRTQRTEYEGDAAAIYSMQTSALTRPLWQQGQHALGYLHDDRGNLPLVTLAFEDDLPLRISMPGATTILMQIGSLLQAAQESRLRLAYSRIATHATFTPLL